jgi:hypothetical protein
MLPLIGGSRRPSIQ